MPVQTWTPGQVLTAAELTSVTNMLPAVQVTGANVNPAVAGTMYKVNCTGGNRSVDLPAAASSTNGLVGVYREDNSSNTLTINAASGDGVNNPNFPTSGTQTSIQLVGQGTYIILVCDGTSWAPIAEELVPCTGAVQLFGTGAAAAGTQPGIGSAWPEPYLEQVDDAVFSPTSGGATVSYPEAFPNGSFYPVVSWADIAGPAATGCVLAVTNVTKSGFKIHAYGFGGEVTSGADGHIAYNVKGF